MKIKELFGKNKTVISFEVFPPKKESSIGTIYKTLDELKALEPDYISVTYGAGGNLADTSTLELASHIKNTLGIEAMAHLTCVNSSKEDLNVILDSFRKNNIDNILALRGDINPEKPPRTDFKYANDLITFIKANGDFGISAACYPEVHTEAPDMITDIKNLKNKISCGAETLVSQLFFENSVFYDFCEKLRLVSIDVPVSAGIMPVTNKNQIERMVSLCGASLPQKFVKVISRYENNPTALIDAGIAYATDQIVDLISNGVEGIHIYTMNNPYIAKKITDSIRSLI